VEPPAVSVVQTVNVLRVVVAVQFLVRVVVVQDVPAPARASVHPRVIVKLELWSPAAVN